MIVLDFSEVSLKLKKESSKTYVFDIIRKKWIVLTPEEHVRQYLINFLCQKMNYPTALIAVEKKIVVGSVTKRFDIVVFNRNHQPWLLAECKAPEIDINNTTLYQLLSYHSSIPCRYWLMTNGHQSFCADACDVNNIHWLSQLPVYDT